ncbi:uncharacterized protein LOC135334225 [Halichondria panicea]|uniref:uncharacterized protein LOC135334225 n=1 Tax=Halichondria panicea TaxID=6063 RepID=UPI00312BBC87
MSTNFSKVEAVFSHIIGAKVQVVSPDDKYLIDGQTISVDELFQRSHDCPSSSNPPSPYTCVPYQQDTYDERPFRIIVDLPKGLETTFFVSSFNTIEQIKSSIEMKAELPHHDFQLLHGGEQLQDDKTVGYYPDIQEQSTLHVVMPVKRWGSLSEPPAHVFKLSSHELAPKYNYDFTNEVDDGRMYMRGGYKYDRPYGWERFALNVVGKYGDDSWLGPNGIRTESAMGEWPVAYHGTKGDCVAGIVDEGFKAGPRELYGPGVYTSPSLAVADYFAGIVIEKNQTKYKCVLQSRVDPRYLRVIPDINGHHYWISPENNAVRPYGILLKKF